MAEAALYGLAVKLVGTITSPAFEAAYERACSVWKANDAFEGLKESIEMIQAILVDAERKQEGSAAVKALVERIKDVLYKAEDLCDEVATNDLLRQHSQGNKRVKKVQDFFSGLNPVVSNNSIAVQAEDITNKWNKVYSDMKVFKFVQNLSEKPISSARIRGVTTGGAVMPKGIIGRTQDKDALLKLIFDGSDPDPSTNGSPFYLNASLIAIVGIGGMGKSTLAQLVYHDDAVLNEFDDSRRWWVCISDVLDVRVVLRKICQSLKIECNESTDLTHMQSSIQRCMRGEKKFFLVLDDVWDHNRGSLDKWLPLLGCEVAQGSKILITTRSSEVATAMYAVKDHLLKGLPADKSWELFMSWVSRNNQETDLQKDSDLGRKIMEKCADVPLAIKFMASFLCTRDPDEWDALIDEGFPVTTTTTVEESITTVLKLSYDYLPSYLKECFAYCALFQKDAVLDRKKVIYLWVAQGFVVPTRSATLEANGHTYFMDLCNGCFFEEASRDVITGAIATFKMHSLIRELAVRVAGKASVALMEAPAAKCTDARKIRHVRVGREIDASWNIPPLLLKAGCTRSLLFTRQSCIGPQVLKDQVKKLKLLRALDLQGLNIKSVPSSIGELKYLRYLNLSDNVKLQALPDSITKSVNLLSLDVSDCSGLLSLPKGFRRLISLVHLDISECTSLRHMPVGFGGLTSLQHLSDFKVTKGSGSDGNCVQNGLAALKGLNLHGQLRISYDNSPTGGWSDDEVMSELGQIPKKIQVLSISGYPGTKIPSLNLIELKSLKLAGCRKAMHFPSFRCLPRLRELMLDDFAELKYMQGDEGSASNETFFFPKLQLLELTELPKLEGWSQGQQASASFPKLSRVTFQQCPRLKSIPSSPALKQVSLTSVGPEIVQQLVSSSAADLKDVKVTACRGLTSLPVQALASLLKLDVRGCPRLEELQLQSGVLEDLTILRCPKLKLWDQGEDTVGVDWGSLRSLRVLFLDKSPEPGKIPDCLTDLKAKGQLRIKGER